MDNFDAKKKVEEYEKYLNETLRADLKLVLDSRDKIYEDLAEYLQLKNVIQAIKDSKLEDNNLKTQVDLGCNFYAQAKVDDPSKIFVCVGFGFYVEFTLDEALKFIEKKVQHMNEKTDSLTADAAKIKAHIKLVIEGLRELQNITPELQKEHRDIFS